jgi:hypothetical protein
MLEVLLDMQLTLIKVFGWSLADIDRTDAVSLFDLAEVRHLKKFLPMKWSGDGR